MGGVGAVSRSDVGMMGCCFGLLVFVMFCGHAVVARGFFVMLGGGMMVGAGGMLVRHEQRSVGSFYSKKHHARETNMSEPGNSGRNLSLSRNLGRELGE